MAGLAALAMRRAGSEREWSFTGGKEISSGYRIVLLDGACAPASRRELHAGEPLMVDIHAMSKPGLGDHSHNYLIAPITDRQWWHPNNFLDIVKLTLKTYRAGVTRLERRYYSLFEPLLGEPMANFDEPLALGGVTSACAGGRADRGL